MAGPMTGSASNPESRAITSGFRVRSLCSRPGMTKTRGISSPRPLVAHAQEFHRPVRDGDPEGRADGACHQMDFAPMAADQFGGDPEPDPPAPAPPSSPESLHQ